MREEDIKKETMSEIEIYKERARVKVEETKT